MLLTIVFSGIAAYTFTYKDLELTVHNGFFE